MGKYLTLQIRVYLDDQDGVTRGWVRAGGSNRQVNLDLTLLSDLLREALQAAEETSAEGAPPPERGRSD